MGKGQIFKYLFVIIFLVSCGESYYESDNNEPTPQIIYVYVTPTATPIQTLTPTPSVTPSPSASPTPKPCKKKHCKDKD